MIVADTNLIGYLLLTSPHSELAEKVLNKEPQWVAPLLWRSEFRNVLALYMRQNIVKLDDALGIMDAALEMMSGEEYEVASHRVLEIANQCGCSAYDCEFIALAKELEVPLITSDKKLLKAFPHHAISPSDFCSTTDSDEGVAETV